NRGSLQVQSGTLAILHGLSIDGSGALGGSIAGTLTVRGEVVGSTTGAAALTPRGITVLNGPDGGSAQHLEVMSADLGAVRAGFSKNAAYGTLTLTGGRVQLVDNTHNSGGAGADALYVGLLNLPSGAVLDLNGLHVYARAVSGTGQVI